MQDNKNRKKNIGPAAARNIGAEASCGEILFFLDSDIISTRDTIGQIVKAFKNNPQISALFVRIRKIQFHPIFALFIKTYFITTPIRFHAKMLQPFVVDLGQ